MSGRHINTFPAFKYAKIFVRVSLEELSIQSVNSLQQQQPMHSLGNECHLRINVVIEEYLRRAQSRDMLSYYDHLQN